MIIFFSEGKLKTHNNDILSTKANARRRRKRRRRRCMII
jgi:hypothetical protein